MSNENISEAPNPAPNPAPALASTSAPEPPLTPPIVQPPPKKAAIDRWFWCMVILMLVCSFSIPWLGTKFSSENIGRFRLIAWLVNMALFAGLTARLGYVIKGRYSAAFIDERNQMSLSRMQMALWTILLISAWFSTVASNYAVGKPPKPAIALAPSSVATGNTNNALSVSPKVARVGDVVTLSGAGFGANQGSQGVTINGKSIDNKNIVSWNEANVVFRVPQEDWEPNQTVAIGATLTTQNGDIGKADLTVLSGSPNAVSSALDVAIPAELWGALGISLASLVGAPLVLNPKREENPSDSQLAQMANTLAVKDNIMDANPGITAIGSVVCKGDASQARFVDMFRGDEISNSDTLDLSKLQMFFFTLALVSGYTIALGAMFLQAKDSLLTSLPALSSGFVALLGLSHAGYLANKAVPRTAANAKDV